MSYDVYLELDGGAGEYAEVCWRTAVMWREAGCDIAEYDGRSARDFGEALHGAIVEIESRPRHYAQWNPPNVESTLEFLRELQAACVRFPAARVVVSR